jgi:hypothetical protein
VVALHPYIPTTPNPTITPPNTHPLHRFLHRILPAVAVEVTSSGVLEALGSDVAVYVMMMVEGVGTGMDVSTASSRVRYVVDTGWEDV